MQRLVAFPKLILQVRAEAHIQLRVSDAGRIETEGDEAAVDLN